MKIGIVGLGLIGGSLGIDLRACGLEVIGISRHQETCKIALERGIVDEASVHLSQLSTTEIIFICTPIAAIFPTVQKIIPYLSFETIIADVGSVKKPIVEECSPLWKNFLGGHPMAGTADQGIDAAQKDLFKGASYVLTPTENTPLECVKKVAEIVQLLKSNVYICSPDVHDRAVAWISHLPVMVSASLIQACMNETNLEILQLAQQLASSGFRDTSRVGGGNPELGVMMARYNRQELLRSLFQYRQNLDQLIEQIEQENWDNLSKILSDSQKVRTRFLS